MVETSIYVHIPFCEHRCAYCDFNTYAGIDHLIPSYIEALENEIKTFTAGAGKLLSSGSVYFGGGTPSLLSAGQVEQVLNSLYKGFQVKKTAEITLEMNPGTVSQAYFADIRKLGVNRISLGMQSSSPGELELLERIHDFGDVVMSIQWARDAGFSNISLDLIFGLPDQTLRDWENSLEDAIRLNPEHFSLYALTIERGTPMESWVNLGQINSPDPDLAADMYLLAVEKLQQAGYRQYEISNWALENDSGIDYRCMHNLQYWRSLPYVGFGAGAHGFIEHQRIQNILVPTRYIHRIKEGKPVRFPATPASSAVELLSQNDEIAEMLMMGLRLTQEGVSSQEFNIRFGIQLDDYFDREISKLVNLGLLEWGGVEQDRLRLTERGRLLGNQVFVEFI